MRCPRLFLSALLATLAVLPIAVGTARAQTDVPEPTPTALETESSPPLTTEGPDTPNTNQQEFSRDDIAEGVSPAFEDQARVSEEEPVAADGTDEEFSDEEDPHDCYGEQPRRAEYEEPSAGDLREGNRRESEDAYYDASVEVYNARWDAPYEDEYMDRYDCESEGDCDYASDVPCRDDVEGSGDSTESEEGVYGKADLLDEAERSDQAHVDAYAKPSADDEEWQCAEDVCGQDDEQYGDDQKASEDDSPDPECDLVEPERGHEDDPDLPWTDEESVETAGIDVLTLPLASDIVRGTKMALTHLTQWLAETDLEHLPQLPSPSRLVEHLAPLARQLNTALEMEDGVTEACLAQEEAAVPASDESLESESTDRLSDSGSETLGHNGFLRRYNRELLLGMSRSLDCAGATLQELSRRLAVAAGGQAATTTRSSPQTDFYQPYRLDDRTSSRQNDRK